MKRLEALTPGPVPVRAGQTTLEETRALEADIRRLEVEMGPEELRESRAQDVSLEERLEGFTLEEKIAAVERQIEELEDAEGGGA